MLESLLAYASVSLLSALKFIPGVLLSLALGMNFWERTLSTGIGGMLGVVAFTFFGSAIRNSFGRLFRRRFLKKKAQQPPAAVQGRSMRLTLWHKFGLPGVSILAPFLMPAIATAIALGFNTSQKKILLWMLPSMFLWALLFALTGDELLLLWKAAGWPLPAGLSGG